MYTFVGFRRANCVLVFCVRTALRSVLSASGADQSLIEVARHPAVSVQLNRWRNTVTFINSPQVGRKAFLLNVLFKMINMFKEIRSHRVILRNHLVEFSQYYY